MRAFRLLMVVALASCTSPPAEGAAACGDDPASFNIKLLHTDCLNGRLDFFGSSQPADGLSVSITGDGIDQPIEKDVSASEKAEMPAVPCGTHRVATVVAKRQGSSVAYGKSAPFDLKKDQQNVTIEVLMYPMWQFARVGGTDGQCSALEPRAASATTVLEDGRVLIAGGYTGTVGPSTFKSSDLTSSVQLFDPTTGLVTNGPDMPPGDCNCTGRGFDTAITLDDGRVMVAGGYTLHQPRKKDVVDPVIYDPARNTWTVAKLKSPRREFVPVLLVPDGSGVRKVVAISGRPQGAEPLRGDDTDPPLTSYEVFDPTTNEWTQKDVGSSFPGVSGYRVGELALTGIDTIGRTLSQGFAVVSGYAPSPDGTTTPYNDTFYAFDRTNGHLLGATHKISPAVLDPGVVGLNKGVLVLGGIRADDHTVSNQWYLWNGQSDTETGTVNNGAADACTVVLDQYRSLMMGGQSDFQVLMATTGITGLAQVGPPPIPGRTDPASLGGQRQALSCLRLSDHQVLAMGGYGLTTGGNATLGSMEIYSFDSPSTSQ